MHRRSDWGRREGRAHGHAVHRDLTKRRLNHGVELGERGAATRGDVFETLVVRGWGGGCFVVVDSRLGVAAGIHLLDVHDDGTDESGEAGSDAERAEKCLLAGAGAVHQGTPVAEPPSFLARQVREHSVGVGHIAQAQIEVEARPARDAEVAHAVRDGLALAEDDLLDVIEQNARGEDADERRNSRHGARVRARARSGPPRRRTCQQRALRRSDEILLSGSGVVVARCSRFRDPLFASPHVSYGSEPSPWDETSPRTVGADHPRRPCRPRASVLARARFLGVESRARTPADVHPQPRRSLYSSRLFRWRRRDLSLERRAVVGVSSRGAHPRLQPRDGRGGAVHHLTTRR